MNMVKLGNRYINLDLVADFWDSGDAIDLFAADGTTIVAFRGEYRAALLRYLDRNAKDLHAGSEPPVLVDLADAGASAYETKL